MHFLMLITISAAFILSVYSNPIYPGYFCNQWCYNTFCCDYGYYGNANTHVMSSTTYCPVFNCENSTTLTEECTNNDDCKRKEMCCEHPCFEGKKHCAEHVKENPIEMGCKAITNCYKWFNSNTTIVLCKDDNDCKRSETCCYVPCKGAKVCQITENFTGTSTGTDHIFCPTPDNCY